MLSIKQEIGSMKCSVVSTATPWSEEWYWNTTIFKTVNNPSELLGRMTGWQSISNVESKVFRPIGDREWMYGGNPRDEEILQEDLMMYLWRTYCCFPTNLKLKTDLYRLNMSYLRIYVYAHMNAVTIKNRSWIWRWERSVCKVLNGGKGKEKYCNSSIVSINPH